jgi:hypothetical protein
MTKAHMTQNIKSVVWLLIFAAIINSCSYAATRGSETIPKSIQGVWLFVSIYETPNIQGISDPESKSLIGSKLEIMSNWLASCKQRVKISKVSVSSESSKEFFENSNGVSFKDVSIRSDQTQYIEMTDDDTGNCFGTYELPGVQLYVKNHNEMVVYFSGVFYRVVRAVKQ